jgi:hypothetical protein
MTVTVPPVWTAILKAEGIPIPVAEYVFHPTRKWRFDFAWVDKSVALEVDGAVWTQGRHTRGAGKLADMEKLRAAAARGWLVLPCAPNETNNAEVLQCIKAALNVPRRATRDRLERRLRQQVAVSQDLAEQLEALKAKRAPRVMREGDEE